MKPRPALLVPLFHLGFFFAFALITFAGTFTGDVDPGDGKLAAKIAVLPNPSQEPP